MSNTIAQSLSALVSAKTAIATAITEKGGTVNSGDGFSDFAADIATITGGGGDEALTEEVTRLRKLIDGSATTLIVPSGITSVKQYLCYQSSSSTTLVSVDLGSVTTIGQYAFYQCRAIEIVRKEIDGSYYLPRSINNVGQYAFYYGGYNKQNSNGYILHPTSTATIGNYAFYYSPVSKVRGTYSSIGSYAFQYAKVNEVDVTCSGAIGSYAFQSNPVTTANVVCAGLNDYALQITNSGFTSLNLKVTGVLNSYAVADAQYLETFTFDPTSVVSTLGSYAFRGLGARRSGTTKFTLDFSNSTFATVGAYAFYPNSTSYPVKNVDITLPATVKTVESNAFRYLKDSIVRFKSDAPPTISASSSFDNMSGTYITCPYQSIGAYRTKANLTTVASVIRGEASDLTEFPELNSEGYELTWYTDAACTEAVASGATPTSGTTYYAVASANIVAVPITWSALNCTVAPTDGNKTYVSGDMVRVGFTLTLNVTAGSGTPTAYIQTVNGTNFSAGDTFTVPNSAVAITAIYWDGENVPVNPTFADNSWDLIKTGCKLGLAAQLWSVGDTKSVTLNDGRTYTVRIADLMENRYQYADGTTGGTHAVFEFVELINANGTTTFDMNSSATNSGGFPATRTKTVHLDQTIYNLLPSDLKDALEEIVVYSSNGRQSSMVSANCKLFLPSAYEVFDSGTASNYSYNDTNSKGRWQNYTNNDNTTYRTKKVVGTTSGVRWWLRSPLYNFGTDFCCVYALGSLNSGSAFSSFGVSPAFAF